MADLGDGIPAPLMVADLARRGLAREVEGGWMIYPEGQKLLRENQAAISAWCLANPDEARTIQIDAMRAARGGK